MQTDEYGTSLKPAHVLDDSMRALILELERASMTPTSSDEWLCNVSKSREGIPPQQIKARMFDVCRNALNKQPFL